MKKKRRKIVLQNIDEVLNGTPATHYNESTRLEEADGPRLPHEPDFQRMEKEWLERLRIIFGD